MKTLTTAHFVRYKYRSTKAILLSVRCAVLNVKMMRELREKAGLSQADAATKAGLSNRQRWHQIESGAASNITMDMLDRIAKALGVKAAALVK